MKSFEERKQEYLNKLMANQEIVLSMRANTPPANMMMMLNPSNEKELTVSETSFALISDIFNLFMNFEGEANIEENYTANLYVDIINKLKNNEDIGTDLFDPNNAADIARCMYDTILLPHIGIDAIGEYVANKCGFDTNDFISMQMLETYMNQAAQMVQEKSTTSTTPKAFDEMTDEDIKLLIDYANEFHKLYEAGMNIDSDNKTKGTK